MSDPLTTLSKQTPPSDVVPMPVTEQLASLLGLTDAGLGISHARIVGKGARASADIYLTDGTHIEFESLRDFANPTRLAVEITACTGATPTLKAPMALKALSMLTSIAQRHEGFTADQLAREWGVTYLQAASVIDVDMNDQAARWEAFCHLNKIDPWRAAQDSRAPTVAAGSIVLRDQAGVRLVRAGWFRAYVRAEGEPVSYAELAHRMERVGWRRRGNSGRIKATQPGFHGRLAWNFYEVPETWEDAS